MVAHHLLPLIGGVLDLQIPNQTHHSLAAIKVLAPELHALSLLTLPGIDPNDVGKTLTTTMLYLVVLSWVPVVDVDTEGLAVPSPSTSMGEGGRHRREPQLGTDWTTPRSRPQPTRDPSATPCGAAARCWPSGPRNAWTAC